MVKPKAIKSNPVAIGIRVKSGWATAVLVAGPWQSPQVFDRRLIELSDHAVPESKQPYHARMGVLEEDDSEIARRTKVVQRVTMKSVDNLIKYCRDSGYKIRGAGLVVGSQIDPESIKNPHIRAHALEGRLFRTVLEKALRSHDVSSMILIEREAYSRASTVLSRSEVELRRAVSEFGRLVNGPWRADEKLAALAAWMVLR